MNARVGIGLLLLVAECFALRFGSGLFIHSALPLAVVSVASVRGRRLRLPAERYALAIIGIALIAALWWLLLPPQPASGLLMLPFSGASLFYIAALFCFWHQCLQIVVEVRHRTKTLRGPFASLPCEGAFVLAAAGHFNTWASHDRMFAVLVICFAVLTVAYYLAAENHWMFSRYTTGMQLFSGVLLVLTLCAGVYTAILVRDNEARINTWLDSFTVAPPPETAIGFSREGRLTNITERRAAQDQTPALFVSSERVPGYLRGLAFDTYNASRWVLPNPERWLSGETAVEAASDAPERGRKFFRLAARPGTETRRMEVFTSDSLTNALFLPQNVSGVYIDTESISIDYALVVRESKPERRPGYTVLESAEAIPQELSAYERERYLQVPAGLDPRIQALARDVTGGAQTNHEKASAVEQYFISNYEYELGIQVPRGQEPLNYFLIERPAAHCEYFASGAAMLLRLSGVPSRYVTGFVAVERNESGDFFIARNKDAHAWVEAWDPERGWFIVEATPPEGIPTARDAGFFSGFRDSLALAWARFRDRIGAEGYDSLSQVIVEYFRAFAASVYGKIALLGLLAFALARVRWLRLRKRGSKSLPEELIKLRALLGRADAMAQQLGLTRGSNETVRQFAERLKHAATDRASQELAEWYGSYERVRYRDFTNEAAYEFLRSSLPEPQPISR